jgi:phage terminase Nu1 subunit (DNA packaging protein)
MAKGSKKRQGRAGNPLAALAAERGVSRQAVEKQFRKFREAGWRADLANPPPDLTASKARLAAAQAEKQEVENRVRSGQLLERDDVHRANVEHGSQVRARLLNAGNELGPMLSGLDARAIKSELDRWAAELLTQWADWAEERTDG